MSSPDELLSFKEFTPTHDGSSSAQININSPKKSNIYDDPNDFQIDMLDQINAQRKEEMNSGKEQPEKSYSFLSLEFYQQFFDVDTTMVIDRIATSMIPKRAPGNYLRLHVGLTPDLYGPFWIVITLIFSIAISGNISSYLQNAEKDYHWRYNFHLVSYAATAIIFYACLVPLALWAALKWSIKPVDPDLETESNNFTPNLLALICIYGYSLAIYIPVSILWVIQISFLQWLLVLTAAFLSGSVLVFVLMPAIRNSKLSLFIVIGIITAHFLLAAGFMLYFFHVPNDIVSNHVQHITTIKAITKIISLNSNNASLT